jgi:hypothetical protein
MPPGAGSNTLQTRLATGGPGARRVIRGGVAWHGRPESHSPARAATAEGALLGVLRNARPTGTGRGKCAPRRGTHGPQRGTASLSTAGRIQHLRARTGRGYRGGSRPRRSRPGDARPPGPHPLPRPPHNGDPSPPRRLAATAPPGRGPTPPTHSENRGNENLAGRTGVLCKTCSPTCMFLHPTPQNLPPLDGQRGCKSTELLGTGGVRGTARRMLGEQAREGPSRGGSHVACPFRRVQGS